MSAHARMGRSLHARSAGGALRPQFTTPRTAFAMHSLRGRKAKPVRQRLQPIKGEYQSGNTATIKRTSGPPMEPPEPPDEGGGGGGGWDNFKNVGMNALFLLVLFVLMDDSGRVLRFFENPGAIFAAIGGGGGPGGPGGAAGGGGGGGGGGGQVHSDIVIKNLKEDGSAQSENAYEWVEVDEEEERRRRKLRKAAKKKKKAEGSQAAARLQMEDLKAQDIDHDAMMSALMKDSELMTLMQKPHVIQALMDIQTDPDKATQLLSDPDISKVMKKVTQLHMGQMSKGQ